MRLVAQRRRNPHQRLADQSDRRAPAPRPATDAARPRRVQTISSVVIPKGLLLLRPARCRSSSACARVAAGTSVKAARSSGVSTSSAMPGRRSTVGRMPHASAARKCGKKLSSPKRNGTASGGEQMIAFDPRSSRDGAIVKAGAGRCAARSCVISAGVTSGISPGTVSMPGYPFAASKLRRRRHRSAVAVAGAYLDHAGAIVLGQAGAPPRRRSRPPARRDPASRRAPSAHPRASPASAPAAARAAAPQPAVPSPDPTP